MMRILVCVKQVRDDTSPVVIDAGGKGYVDDGSTVYRMNRLDEYALEEAVLIKEKFPGTTVDAVSVGPERVRAVVKKALEKGADNGYHILTGEEAYPAPSCTARALADFSRTKGYNIILTGVMSEDDMNSQTGSMLAGLLGIPCAVSVIAEEIKDHNVLEVVSELEGGMRERARLAMPCLLTIQSGINRPRYPSLSNVMRARTQEIPVIKIEGSEPQMMATLSLPVKTGRGLMLTGTAGEKAEQLLGILHEKALL